MKPQRGIALVTAIFVVLLATIAGVGMVVAANVAMHRSANLVQSESEWWYAQGIESWVKTILLRDEQMNKIDGLSDIWAQPVDFLPIDGGAIKGQIVDLQGRFNLNNLAGPLNSNPQAATGGNNPQAPTGATLHMQEFERLLENLPNFDASRYKGLSFAVRDWIDADGEVSGAGGAEDEDYLGQKPPYRAANQLMKSPSELLLVKGMTPELYTALEPYVTALPASNTPINVNTASEPVLMSLAAEIDRSAVEKFLSIRKLNPIEDVAAVHGTGPAAFLPATIPAAETSITTQYFELQAQVFVGSGRLALYSVVYRPSGGTPVVIAHSTNTE